MKSLMKLLGNLDDTTRLTGTDYALIIFLTCCLITFAASFISIETVLSVKDHPIISAEISVSERVLIASYSTTFLYIGLLLLLPLNLIFFRFSLYFLRIKRVFPANIFLLFMLALVHSCYALERHFWESRLTNLVLIPLYFLLPILISIKYRNARRNKKIAGFVICIFITLVGILCSMNNTKYIAPIEEDLVRYVVVALTVLCSVFVFGFDHLQGIWSDVHDRNRAQLKSVPRLIRATVIALIILPVCICIAAYQWEGRPTAITYKPVTSSTGMDTNVIIVMVDTLRADHLSCYGYTRQTSPCLDAFARECVRFENCYTQASWTKPSVAGLLTSLYPLMHGALFHGSVLPQHVTTLAEVMKTEGYVTYAYIANPNLKAVFEFDQGFDFYDDYMMRDKLYFAVLRNLQTAIPLFRKVTNKTFSISDRDNIKLANNRIVPWLERYRDKNFFMYLHYMDPHHPYSPPDPYDKMFPYTEGDENSRNLALYDGEIRFTDENIKKLFDKLKELGIYDKTMIVFTSDHGEAFGEHNDYRHGHTIYNELLKVPLVIKYPDSLYAGRVVEEQVRTIDIMPTILDSLKISTSLELEGNRLLPLIEGGRYEQENQYVYIDNNYDYIFIQDGVIENNEWKYIFTEKSGIGDVNQLAREELYNIRYDPFEMNNLLDKEPGIAARMRDKLDYYRNICNTNSAERSSIELDRETIQDLISLGYLK